MNAIAALDSVRPEIQWFRSVAMLVVADASGQDFQVSAARLADWLFRYDALYKRLIGVEQGSQIHLLYHRDLSVIGDELLAQTEGLLRLAAAAGRCGMGFSLSVPLEEALANRTEVDRLLDSGDVTSFALMIGPRSEVDSPEALNDLLGRIVRSKAHIGFTGAYSRIRELELLAHPLVAGAQVTLHPKQTAAAKEIPEHPVMPCVARLRVYVAPDGTMYPCLGLVGVPGAELGHIDDEPDRTELANAANLQRFDQFARLGPEYDAPAPMLRATGLPWACERHRLELIAHGDDASSRG